MGKKIKGTMTMDFMIFVAGMLIMIAILSLVFGSTVIGPVMSFLAPSNPQYLAEEYASFFSVASFAPGDMKMGIKPNVIRTIKLQADGDGYNVSVAGVSGDTFEGRRFPNYHDNTGSHSVTVNEMEIQLRTQAIMYAQKLNNEMSLTEEVAQ